MYLKSLEIQGFKSFPDKTTVCFGNEITSIVGPNGSGKSNISDAIRWVMGEQSTKALRGGKMEDVIFGGTLKRAQVGFAEASLLLDNGDGALAIETKEVMVTRRYYRSGDSEYYINKQTARLRDIHELFMDTGLGREGYSNIGQGRVDEILSVKSGDRREVFEEAAGISKFRHRKEETQRRLLTTQDNLLRIGDKISELELQRDPLEKQATKAQEYLRLGGILKGLEITIWLSNLEKLAQAAKKAQEDYNSASFILEQEHQNLEELYTQVETMGGQLHEKDLGLEKIREEISEIEGRVAQKEADLAVLSTNLENTKANILRMTQELEGQAGRASSLEEQIAQKEARIAQLQEDAKNGSGQQQELVSQIEANRNRLEDMTATVGDYQRKLAIAETELSTAEQQLEVISTASSQYESQRKLALDGCIYAQEQEAKANQNLTACQESLNKAKESVSSEGNAMAGYELRLQSRLKKQQTLATALQQASIALDTTTARLTMLREMERDFEGYSKAVRLVMQDRNLRGIIGPVSQVMQVDDEYSVAVETALGAAMQHILVEDENCGKGAISMLKRRDGGRATFLPVSTIRGRNLEEQGLERCSGFVGIGSQLIDYDPEYKGVFENLLGRTVFVEGIDQAISMAKQYRNRFRIVTLDGQVLNQGGSMTGGSASRSAGILSRANEKKRLEEAQLAQREEQLRLSKEKNAIDIAVSQVGQQKSATASLLRQAEDEVLRLEGQLTQCELLVNNGVQATAQAQETLRLLEQSATQSLDKTQELSQDVEKFNGEITDLTEALYNLMEERRNQEAKNQLLSEQLAKWNREEAATVQEIASQRDSVVQLRGLMEAMAGDQTQKTVLMEQYEEECSQLGQGISQGKLEKETLLDELEQAKDGLQKAILDRATLEEKKTKREKESQDKSKDILSMERECARLEQKKQTATMEESQIVEKLWDSYELTPSTATAHAVEVESMTNATREVQTLKRKISALGTPNLGAIEEFARVSERYDYLTAQRDDVLFAKKELEHIIETITTEMVEIFVREFNKINEYFGKTFEEMFGGGKGSLVLEDPADPLGCGIEIRVQPPGKQVKTITLLSGGEKAFVAIALYFAILKVRPTPFCLLDEIDAALDDNNVSRFASYLRKLSDNTQFIVITHRRGTMEGSDVLYGVTMEEQGISKILHIDLDQMEQELGIYAK